MANAPLTNKSAAGIIAKAAAAFLDDHIQFVKTIDKAEASDFGGMNGYNAGDTIQIAVPPQYTLGTGADITSSIQDTIETKVPLAVTNQYNVPMAFSSANIATDIALKSWMKRVMEPQMITLANNIESACISQAVLATANLVGTAGSTVFSNQTILQAGQKLDEAGCADYSNRYVLLSPAANVSAVDARKGLFQKSDNIAEQYIKGAMGTSDGFDFLRNNLLPTFTMGTQNVTGVTATADLTSGSGSVALTGLGNAKTVTAGTVLQIAGVYAVHPVTKATLSTLKQFVVTTGGTSSAGGALTVTVAPVIYGPLALGQQNVSTLTANGAAVTFSNMAASTAYTQNLAYHKSAFRFVSLPLVQPNGVDMVAQETVNGITVRILRDYDVLKDRLIMRADVLWGLANVRPEFASRITA